MSLRRVGYKHWEIWLYYTKDNSDKTPDACDSPMWQPVTDLLVPLRLMKPGRMPDGLTLFPEKLLVAVRAAVTVPFGGPGYGLIGYFIGGEAEPRLVLKTTSFAYEELSNTFDISDVFSGSNAQSELLTIAYKVGGVLGTYIYLSCHQVYYCVRR